MSSPCKIGEWQKEYKKMVGIGGPKGNTYNMKFPTPEARKQLLENYIKHVSLGYSDECFLDCDIDTFKRYTRDFPSEFPTDKITAAKRMRQYYWEQAGNLGTHGQIQGFNAMSWKFNMQNRFDWREKKDVDHTIKEKRSAEERAKILMDQINENKATSGQPSQESEGSSQTSPATS